MSLEIIMNLQKIPGDERVELNRLGYLKMVRETDLSWNQIEASVLLMYAKMCGLDFRYDGENIQKP